MVGGRDNTSPVTQHLQVKPLLSEEQLRPRLPRGGPRDGCSDDAEEREAGEAAAEFEAGMGKSPRFNWRVFLFLRQRQLMLLGGAFLVFVLSSSLVYSVLEAGGEGLLHQHLTGGAEEEDAAAVLMEQELLAQEAMLREQEMQLSSDLPAEEEALHQVSQASIEEWLQAKRLEQQQHQQAGGQQQQQQPPAGSDRLRHKSTYTQETLQAAEEKLEKDPTIARAVNQDRLESVHAAIMHSWEGYKQFAWGDDELLPESREGKKWFGLGLTLVDSLDLLWLINEKQEFYDAAQWVTDELDPSVASDVNVFEVTIRVMGGMLSAYHYSKEDVFLRKARELSENLKGAFHSRSGVPYSDVNLATKRAYAPHGAPDSSTSEATSIQMEFKYLAYLTDDPDLYRLADKSMHAIEHARHQLPADMRALLPMYINPETGNFQMGSTITLGARGDSYYEYLLKQWLLTGKKQSRYLDKYLEAVDAIKEQLLGYSYPHGVAFIGELQSGRRFSPKMDHLVCFLPGTLALGYMHGLDRWHLELAQELMLTCFELYNSTATGLSPEIAYFNMAEEGGAYDILIQPRDAHNILRPETVESLFYLHKATMHERQAQQQQGQQEAATTSVYQEWGWQIFEAFEQHSRVPTGGYSGLQNVQDVGSARINKMESFWLGETLKYFYLLFSEQDLVPLDRYVFNTEAHPIPIFLPPWLEEDDQQQQQEQEEVDWPEDAPAKDAEGLEQAREAEGQQAQGEDAPGA